MFRKPQTTVQDGKYIYHQVMNEEIVIFRDSLRELLNLLTLRNEKLSHQKVILQKFLYTLKNSEQDLDKVFEKGMTAVTDNFKQLRDIIDYKEKETKLKLEQSYSKKKTTLKSEIKNFEQNLANYQSVFNQINFAIKHFDNYFIEGKSIKLSSYYQEQGISLQK